MRTLGVDVRNTDGSLRTFGEMLPDLADGFARFADNQSKTAIAVRLFGQEAGARMAQLLSQGSASITQMSADLDRTLPKFDPEVIARFQRAQDDLSQTFKNLSVQFANFAAGPAANVLEALNAIVVMIGRLVSSARIASTEELAALRGVNQALQERDQVMREIEALNEKRSAAALFSLERKELDALHDAAWQRLARLRQEYDQFMAVLTTPRGNVAGKLGIGEADGRPSIGLPDPKVMAELQAQLAATMTALSGQDPTQSIISQYLFGGREPAVWTDAFKNAMAEIDRVGKLSGQTATQISNQKIAAMRLEQSQMMDTATLAASTLTQVFADNKAAAIAAAAINTAVGITRALQLPTPMSWIQAGLIAASGVAQMATIRSSSPGSASTPSVNGGTGDEGSQAAQTLFVEGINPNAVFSGEMVRDLAERLLQYQRDGGRVVGQSLRARTFSSRTSQTDRDPACGLQGGQPPVQGGAVPVYGLEESLRRRHADEVACHIVVRLVAADADVGARCADQLLDLRQDEMGRDRRRAGDHVRR